MTEFRVGDHVAFRWVDQMQPGTSTSDMPVVDGVIISTPVGASPYYEIETGELPDTLFARGLVSEEGEELPYLAQPRDIVCKLPTTMSREDVEAWLAS